MNTRREPRFFTVEDGSVVVTIPLANGGGEAVLDAGDFGELTDWRISTNFKLNNNGKRPFGYVRAKQSGGDTVSVARFIVRAGRGEIVRCRDGNRTNLRRSNLELSSGPAKMDCGDHRKNLRGVLMMETLVSSPLRGDSPLASTARDHHLQLIRLPEVRARTGLSRSTIYAEEARGRFPRHVKLGERSSAWVAAEVEEWIALRIGARDALSA